MADIAADSPPRQTASSLGLRAALAYSKLFAWHTSLIWPHRDSRCTCGTKDCDSPGKHPIGGFRAAIRDPHLLRIAYNTHPEAGIGIATGANSGFFVVDVDPRHGGDDSLRALWAMHGLFPPTVQQITGGGGRHFLFK